MRLKLLILKAVPLFLLVSIMVTVQICRADIIYLKNGKKIEVDNVWEEGGIIKGKKFGAVVGYPKEQVEKIERSSVAEPSKASSGFNFDMWRSGMTIQEVMDVAEREDLPLHRQGLISSNDHFNPATSRKYMHTNSVFYYKCNLLGAPASVTLYLTPKSRLLSTIAVHYNLLGLEKLQKLNLISDIENILIRKYGKSIKKTSDFPSIKTTYWKKDERDMVELKNASSFLDLVYKDFEIIRMGQMENFERQEGERRDAIGSDARKF